MRPFVPSAAAVLAGAGLAGATAVGGEPGGLDLLFRQMDHVDSPLAPKWARTIWHPYHGTESSEKIGYDRRSRENSRRGRRDGPLLPAARPTDGAAAPAG